MGRHESISSESEQEEQSEPERDASYEKANEAGCQASHGE
jgi:hypothetical protein